MSFSAKIFNVMVASPGDVASERAIIREVIHEWNAVNSQNRGIVLLPIGWESHASPEMGKSPQKIINEQVLAKCDILVAVFWTRLGTATDEYSSGTVEEIEEQIKKGKMAMLYFSSKPVEVDSVDSEQIKQLKDFKEECKTKGLYESYDSHTDFRNKFYRHLQLKMNEQKINEQKMNEQILPIDDDEFFANAEIIESKIKMPTLSEEASLLLKEASLDPSGSVLHFRHLRGTSLQTNGKNLITTNDRREIARWEASLEELVDSSLLIERGLKGEVFEVTNEGYRVADLIEL